MHRIYTYFLNYITGELRWNAQRYTFRTPVYEFDPSRGRERLVRFDYNVKTDHYDHEHWIRFDSEKLLEMRDNYPIKNNHFVLRDRKENSAPVRVYLTEEQQDIRTIELVTQTLKQANT